MSQQPLLTVWHGWCYRHVPAGSPFGPLETRFAALSATNRWNENGEPTLYFASDPGIVVAEFARHMQVDVNPPTRSLFDSRRLFTVEMAFERVLDLRSTNILDRFGLDQDSHIFLDREIARSIARYARNGLHAEALLAPSVAFLDDKRRFVLVVFLEQLSGILDDYVRSIKDLGTLTITHDG
ncbi:MAG: RES family NAD+ phosphorylase [Thermomicrobiales bacterium]|jgi:RES domain-containing protein|nr:RES family NAD+ phosphorylase [Thermomicrobiales bacterium]